MKGRRSEKLMEQFIGPYKVKSIISVNAVELELPSTVHIHPVVNISKLQLYKLQVEGQKATKPALVIVEEEKEYEVEKILNKRKIWGREKFLVLATDREQQWCQRRDFRQIREERDYYSYIGKINKNSTRVLLALLYLFIQLS